MVFARPRQEARGAARNNSRHFSVLGAEAVAAAHFRRDRETWTTPPETRCSCSGCSGRSCCDRARARSSCCCRTRRRAPQAGGVERSCPRIQRPALRPAAGCLLFPSVPPNRVLFGRTSSLPWNRSLAEWPDRPDPAAGARRSCHFAAMATKTTALRAVRFRFRDQSRTPPPRGTCQSPRVQFVPVQTQPQPEGPDPRVRSSEMGTTPPETRRTRAGGPGRPCRDRARARTSSCSRTRRRAAQGPPPPRPRLLA